MGVFGAALFSDDDAADIRDEYRRMIGDGYEGEAATNIILHQWQQDRDSTVLWLALAATQWRLGRLEERVKTRALRIIDDGSDLARWKELGASASDLRKREAVLSRFRDQITGPLPPKKKVSKQFRSTCDWERGELISYELPSGHKIIFRVLGIKGDAGGAWPVCEILDWIGTSVPEPRELKNLPIRQCVNPKLHRHPQLAIGRASRREFPEQRVRRLGTKVAPAQDVRFPHTFVLWRFLDKALADHYGLT